MEWPSAQAIDPRRSVSTTCSVLLSFPSRRHYPFPSTGASASSPSDFNPIQPSNVRVRCPSVKISPCVLPVLPGSWGEPAGVWPPEDVVNECRCCCQTDDAALGEATTSRIRSAAACGVHHLRTLWRRTNAFGVRHFRALGLEHRRVCCINPSSHEFLPRGPPEPSNWWDVWIRRVADLHPNLKISELCARDGNTVKTASADFLNKVSQNNTRLSQRHSRQVDVLTFSRRLGLLCCPCNENSASIVRRDVLPSREHSFRPRGRPGNPPKKLNAPFVAPSTFTRSGSRSPAVLWKLWG